MSGQWGAELLRAGGRADGRADRQPDMTKLIVAFCNYAEAPKIVLTDFILLFEESLVVGK
jgi:hypothetical protein